MKASLVRRGVVCNTIKSCGICLVGWVELATGFANSTVRWELSGARTLKSISPAGNAEYLNALRKQVLLKIM